MPETLLACRTNVRSLINEPIAQFWSDAELNTWINQACADVQRIAEWAREEGNITTTAGQQAYTSPADLARIYRLEFVPNNNTSYTYSLEFRGYNEMDAVWGNLKSLPSAYPEQYTLWSDPNIINDGGLQILLYPVPAVAGTLNVFYYRTHIDATLDTEQIDILPDWNEIIENYAAYRALQKDADPRWKEFQGEYQAQLEKLIIISRQYTDQANWVSTGQQNYNPLFLDLEE